jgi:transcriptional regulator with XRE-family HTH domain
LLSMIMNPADIKQLRQRLGWSLAEMGRRMGCKADLVSEWETGKQCPDSDVLNQMHYLESYLMGYSERISQAPMAEKIMHEDRLSQLTHRALIDRSQKA